MICCQRLLRRMTGISVHIISPLLCLVCIFYTCVGGLKAVVWTDVVQSAAMFGCVLLVIVKGTANAGGLAVVWSRNWEGGRIEVPDASLDLTVRHSWGGVVLGAFFLWLPHSGANQMMMQRYLSLPTLARARLSVWVFAVVSSFLFAGSCYMGLLIYATYHDCDPLTTKLAAAKDQLVPLLAMQTLGQWPGLPGCFVAGIFSAALSSMSTALNSMAAVVLEDFCKLFWKRPLTERQVNVLMRAVVIVTGVLSLLLVFVVERMGSVLQLALSVFSVSDGPTLGLYAMGMFMPWVNTKGMLVGSCTGLLFMGWIVLGARTAIASGDITFPTKPFSVEGCSYSFPTPAPALSLNSSLAATAHAHSDVLPLYRVSYMWYTLIGTMVTAVVGLAASLVTGANKAEAVDARLLSPVVRRFFAAGQRKRSDASADPAASGYKSIELRVISNSQSAEERGNAPALETARRAS